jgi:hypothetical protein
MCVTRIALLFVRFIHIGYLEILHGIIVFMCVVRVLY